MRLGSATYKLGLITSLLAAATAAGIVCAQVPGGCNTPVSQRTGEAGCYLTATELLGALPQAALFWHLYAYPTHAAAESAKGSRGTVVESFGKVWLYTIADSEWRASSGERIATIGPLPITAGPKASRLHAQARERSCRKARLWPSRASV